jgi:hypothetical protein
MFPQITLVSPLYLALRAVGLIDTVPGLVLPYLTFALPITVWLLTTYFRELPGRDRGGGPRRRRQPPRRAGARGAAARRRPAWRPPPS